MVAPRVLGDTTVPAVGTTVNTRIAMQVQIVVISRPGRTRFLDPGRRAGDGVSDLRWQPEYAAVSLDQGVREQVPRIWCGKGATNQGWHMTEDETRRLAATLTVAADLAAGEPRDQLRLPFDIVAA